MSEEHNDIHDESINWIGNRDVWNGTLPFGVLPEDRRQHTYIVGKTGTGKSTLLRNLILQDIYYGRGVGLVDPHGDLARDVLDHIPRNRTEDVVYFNPADLSYPIGFNLLQSVPVNQRHRVVSGLIGSMKAIWSDSWGPRTEYILSAAISALLECENVSILGIQRMLVDPHYRRWVVKQVNDPIVRSFWTREFEGYDKRFQKEAIAPIQNKVGQLLMAPPLRHVLGQVKRKIDPRFMMDHKRIFIANLSKGALGEDKANLLGSILVTSFEIAAMSRVNVSEEKRQDFFLAIDEFQNFSTTSFSSILSEARKYRLSLTLSHQYLDQVPEFIRKAVFGNVGSMLSFRVGESDAQTISREFGGSFAPVEFSSLGNFRVLAKLMRDGEQQEPFRGRTLAALKLPCGRSRLLVQRSHQRYGSRRNCVEEKLRRWIQ